MHESNKRIPSKVVKAIEDAWKFYDLGDRQLLEEFIEHVENRHAGRHVAARVIWGHSVTIDLDAIKAEFLTQCGPCDFGIGDICNCAKRDYRSTMPALVAEVERLQAVVARVEALAVAVGNRMMATAKPAEIWAALRGEDACGGSPFCPGDTHTEGCYSLAWTDAERQQCTDGRCLTPCTECARATLTEAGGE